MSKSRAALINQFFTEFRLQRTSLKHTPPALAKKPIITIARDPGSGGKPIAKLIAKKLNFEFYDSALIEAISKSSRKRKQIIKNIDEKTRTYIQDLTQSLFNPDYISESTYTNHLCKVILSITYQGGAVILGRGANFIVPYTESLNALITAPRQVRVQRAIKHEKVSEKKARNIIDKTSMQRRDFVSTNFGKQYANPKYYDIILNTADFDLEPSSELIISAYRKKFPNITERFKTTFKRTSRLY